MSIRPWVVKQSVGSIYPHADYGDRTKWYIAYFLDDTDKYVYLEHSSNLPSDTVNIPLDTISDLEMVKFIEMDPLLYEDLLSYGLTSTTMDKVYTVLHTL